MEINECFNISVMNNYNYSTVTNINRLVAKYIYLYYIRHLVGNLIQWMCGQIGGNF